MKNLYKKMAQLQWASVEIKKSGKNDFAKYSYKTFTNIKEAIFNKMSELQLAVIPKGEIIDLQIGNIVSYKRNMLLVDGESGESIEFVVPFIGKNTDADKASGSAITYGLKYLFNLLALLPDETLDPDNSDTTEKVSKTKKEVKQLINAVEEVQSNKMSLLKQLRALQVSTEDGENKLKMLLGIDKNEKIRSQSITSLSEDDLKVLIERMEN